MEKSYEEITREYVEAQAAYKQNIRRWLQQGGVTIESESHLLAQEVNYNVQHQDEVAAMERLAVEVGVARAALDERMVDAHERSAAAHEINARWSGLANEALKRKVDD